MGLRSVLAEGARRDRLNSGDVRARGPEGETVTVVDSWGVTGKSRDATIGKL